MMGEYKSTEEIKSALYQAVEGKHKQKLEITVILIVFVESIDAEDLYLVKGSIEGYLGLLLQRNLGYWSLWSCWSLEILHHTLQITSWIR